MRTNSKLKSGEGEEHYKEFFRVCGELFALMEHKENREQERMKVLIDRAKALDNSHSILKQQSRSLPSLQSLSSKG